MTTNYFYACENIKNMRQNKYKRNNPFWGMGGCGVYRTNPFISGEWEGVGFTKNEFREKKNIPWSDIN
jgi:hypothetical protein